MFRPDINWVPRSRFMKAKNEYKIFRFSHFFILALPQTMADSVQILPGELQREFEECLLERDPTAVSSPAFFKFRVLPEGFLRSNA